MAARGPVRVTPELLAEARRSVDWDRVRAMTDEEIDRDVASDPDASPLTEAEAVALRVQWARKRTGLSQPEFAARFRIPVGTLRDWEQARREPDAAALAYLTVIERDPEAVAKALDAAAAEGEAA